jgi:hypothetical protein
MLVFQPMLSPPTGRCRDRPGEAHWNEGPILLERTSGLFGNITSAPTRLAPDWLGPSPGPGAVARCRTRCLGGVCRRPRRGRRRCRGRSGGELTIVCGVASAGGGCDGDRDEEGQAGEEPHIISLSTRSRRTSDACTQRAQHGSVRLGCIGRTGAEHRNSLSPLDAVAIGWNVCVTA